MQRAGLEAAYRRGDEEALAELMAQYGMYDDYVRLLGGSGEQASRLNAAYAAANGGSGSRSGGSSSGGSSGRSTASAAKPALTAAQTLKAIEGGIVNDTTRAAYEYYFGEAYGSDGGSAAGAAAKMGRAARKATGSKSTNGKTAAAAEKLKGEDATYQHAKAAMMTAREWEQERRSGTGAAGAYETYEDYVAAYNEWLQTLR